MNWFNFASNKIWLLMILSWMKGKLTLLYRWLYHLVDFLWYSIPAVFRSVPPSPSRQVRVRCSWQGVGKKGGIKNTIEAYPLFIIIIRVEDQHRYHPNDQSTKTTWIWTPFHLCNLTIALQHLLLLQQIITIIALLVHKLFPIVIQYLDHALVNTRTCRIPWRQG